MTLKLFSDGTSITGIDIGAVEVRMNAKFVMDTSVRGSGDWVGPVALFYGETEHPVSKSRYFAIRKDLMIQKVVIMDGQSAVDHVYEGLVLDGKVYHSRYHHDFRAVGQDYIDGGLDYTRLVGLTLPIVKFTIVDGEPVFQEELNQRDMASRYPAALDAESEIDAVLAINDNFMDKAFDEYNEKNPGDFWK